MPLCCVIYAECRYAECRYAECRYAECRSAATTMSHSTLKLSCPYCQVDVYAPISDEKKFKGL